jgi:hypothetical protein
VEDKALSEKDVSHLHSDDGYRGGTDYRALRLFVADAELNDLAAIASVRAKRRLAAIVEVGRAAKRRRARLRVVK